jgi:hypothetical protein
VSEPLEIVVSILAAAIRTAEDWWRIHRPKAPNAIREDLDRGSSLIAVQPDVGARAQNVALPGVRRIHLARIRYDLYYRLVDSPRRLEILACKPRKQPSDLKAINVYTGVNMPGCVLRVSSASLASPPKC